MEESMYIFHGIYVGVDIHADLDNNKDVSQSVKLSLDLRYYCGVCGAL